MTLDIDSTEPIYTITTRLTKDPLIANKLNYQTILMNRFICALHI